MECGTIGHIFERDPPKDHPCQVWSKSIQWFQRRRWKYEKFTDADDDDGRKVMTKAHMALWARWAKNDLRIWIIRLFSKFKTNLIYTGIVLSEVKVQSSCKLRTCNITVYIQNAPFQTKSALQIPFRPDNAPFRIWHPVSTAKANFEWKRKKKSVIFR